ncbi:MAG: prepilin-type N-terminal cleavage/methylation domain-containing protein [Deltaproteobacteria bacterium]|nr:prepilin-type N-terminal cleavage/methylation domain-containing protein [Deltaproteobacteria bacterium]
MSELKKSENGFTLIELMVVVGIVGILSSIAVSQLEEYRIRAYNATAQSDLRNAITAQEARYVDTSSYVNCADALACELVLPEFSASRKSDGTSPMAVFSFVANPEDYTAMSKHAQSGDTFTYDSTTGIMATL